MAAKKKSSAKTQAKRKSPSSSSAPSFSERIIEAGLDEAARVGWRDADMDGIAARAGADLGDVLAEIPTKAHFVLRVLDYVDTRSLAGLKKVDTEDSPRDRLFEILMRRFDVLNGNRDGFRSVITATLRDPAAAPLALCRLHRSLSVILSAAGIPASGLSGLLRKKGVAVVGACALRAWLRDDTADLSKTMAALDRALGRAERLANFSPFGRRGAAEESAA